MCVHVCMVVYEYVFLHVHVFTPMSVHSMHMRACKYTQGFMLPKP